jgi:hypothetical protein
MLGLAGFTTMPLSAKGPAHVVRDTAQDPKKNIAKTNLIFFMNIPLESTPFGKTCQPLLSVAFSPLLLKPPLCPDRDLIPVPAQRKKVSILANRIFETWPPCLLGDH